MTITYNYRRLVQQTTIARAQATRLTYTCREIRARREASSAMRIACARLRDVIRQTPITRAKLLSAINELDTSRPGRAGR